MFKDISKIGLAIVKEGSKSVAMAAGVTTVTLVGKAVIKNIASDEKFTLDVIKNVKFDLDDLIMDLAKTVKIVKAALMTTGAITIAKVVIDNAKTTK